MQGRQYTPHGVRNIRRKPCSHATVGMHAHSHAFSRSKLHSTSPCHKYLGRCHNYVQLSATRTTFVAAGCAAMCSCQPCSCRQLTFTTDAGKVGSREQVLLDLLRQIPCKNLQGYHVPHTAFRWVIENYFLGILLPQIQTLSAKLSYLSPRQHRVVDLNVYSSVFGQFVI